MRILIHDYAGHPFQVQLSRRLARRGHTVTHVYASMIETPRGALAPRPDDPTTLAIRGLSISGRFNKHSFVRRRFQERSYGHRLADLIDELCPDWVVSGNTPSEPQSIILSRCRRNGIRFAAWVQDFYGVAVDKLLRKKLPGLGAVAGGYYKWLDARVLARSDRVILITDDFRTLTNKAGINGDRVHVIENWAPIEELPLLEKSNEWAREHGLEGKFVFLYSGTLGMKHNPALLLELARLFRHDPNVRVVVVSEGLGARWLAGRADGAKNLVLLPFQPFDRMPEVLAAGDVLVAVLEPDAGVFSVPSKVLTYLCARKPILAAMPPENLAARIVAREEAGVVVSPTDTAEFLKAAELLWRDRELREACAAHGREYAERAFDIDRITDRFERVLEARA